MFWENISKIINSKIATIGEIVEASNKHKGSNIYSYVHNAVSKDCGKIGISFS